ncbi:hypothetical protein FQR65_LT13576 [Abscondita terminalis]|nr:hypothetical protein FQR65_LT13576 [Abscondita terminalis]
MWCYLMLFVSLSILLLKSFAQEDYLNVVIMFAKYQKISISKIAYVDVPKVVDVKPYIQKHSPCNLRKTVRRRYGSKCNCKQHLNDSIFGLVNWARTSLQMATAIVTLKNDNNENAVTYYLDIDGNKPKEPEQNLLIADPMKQDFGKLPLPSLPNKFGKNCSEDDFPKFEVENPNDEEDDIIVIINSYPPPIRFNPFKKYSKHYENLKRVQKTIGIPSINNQVIHINSKNSIVTTSVPKSNNPIWNLFESISGIKHSFMSNFVDQENFDDEQNFDMSALGKVQKKSLFLVTDRVLENIKSVREKRGFMLVVYGGELSMLDKPYSELVQSIKHVLETCTNTLMVITSSCPNKFARNNTKIPVFATGIVFLMFAILLKKI